MQAIMAKAQKQIDAKKAMKNPRSSLEASGNKTLNVAGINVLNVGQERSSSVFKHAQ